MPKSVLPDNVLSQLDDVLSVWSERPDLNIERQEEDGSITKITYAQIAARHEKLRLKIEAIAEDERKLAAAKDERDDEAKDLSDIRTRGLSLIRGVFGPDSPKYQQAGGTRASERKPRTPKAPKA